MPDKTTVGERGQTAIPARVRRETLVEPGTELLWEVVSDDELRITIIRTTTRPPDPRSMRGFARRFRRTRRTADWMRELRAGEE
jgi:bifunctional DNA-binding transcriptional regulator/antitoxin component of YhaV-PrlF toxin-antitoxin module